jgi:hypothetical protein
MVASALLSVVLAAALATLVTALRTQSVEANAVQQQSTARAALGGLAKTMREATYPAGDTYNNSSIFVSASPDDVTFYSDIAGTGVPQLVRYYLDSTHTILKRDVTTPSCASTCTYLGQNRRTSVITTNLVNLDTSGCSGIPNTHVFSFFDADRGTGQLTVVPAGSLYNNLVDISYVQVTLVLDLNPGHSPNCHVVQTGVSLRNWR